MNPSTMSVFYGVMGAIYLVLLAGLIALVATRATGRARTFALGGLASLVGARLLSFAVPFLGLRYDGPGYLLFNAVTTLAHWAGVGLLVWAVIEASRQGLNQHDGYSEQRFAPQGYPPQNFDPRDYGQQPPSDGGWNNQG